MCSRFHVLIIIFSIATLFFLLSLISFTVVESGTRTYVVLVMNLVGLSVFIVLSGVALVTCRDRL